MAGISAMQKLLNNQLTSKFVRSLKHSDLPEGWADNPEIVALAEDAYREMGTESPFFKAYEKVKGPTEKMYHGTPYGGFQQFKDESYFTPNREYAELYTNPSASSNRSYFQPATNPEVYEVFLASQRPFDTRKPVARNIFNKEFFQKWGNGAPLSERGLPDWTDASDLLEFLGEREGKKFDSVVLDEGGVGGYGDNVVWRGVSHVPMSPEQVKSTSNRGTFNPADPNIYKGLIPAVGAGGLLALLDADEAEAAPKPSYMLDLVKKLEEGNFENGMEFGAYTARDLKKNGLAASGFTPGPIKISPKNLAKFEKKRIGQNHMTPEQFVDGLNSVLHGTRGKAFPNKGDLAMRLSPETDWNGEEPFVRHFWKGVVAPHDGFTGLVTGHKYNTEDAKKDLKRFSGERPSSPFTGTPKEAVTQQGEVSVVENASGLDESTIPASSNSRKAIIPLIAGGAVLAPSEAQGTPYQFPADKRGTVLYEPGLGSPIVGPADLLTAPIGVPTAALKAASVAAEPFISYGMDKAIGGLLSLFSDEEGR